MYDCLNTRLKTIRKSISLSQEEFGKKLGITGAAISKIESLALKFVIVKKK